MASWLCVCYTFSEARKPHKEGYMVDIFFSAFAAAALGFTLFSVTPNGVTIASGHKFVPGLTLDSEGTLRLNGHIIGEGVSTLDEFNAALWAAKP